MFKHPHHCTHFSLVQLLSRVWLFETPWTAACQASLSITNSQSPPKPMSIESVMPSNHLILCCPPLLLPSIFPSIRVFSDESALCIRWSKYWSFSSRSSPSNEYLGLIDWFDLLVVQRALESSPSIQFSSVTRSCPTLCDPMDCNMPGFHVHHQFWSLLKLMSIKSVMQSNQFILCHPLLLLPSIFPSIRVFSDESALCIRWPKYWTFSFNISPSNEHPGLISFRMDWLDLLAVQGTFKSPLQHNSSKASILQHSAFLVVQLSHPYMTTGKTIALTG